MKYAPVLFALTSLLAGCDRPPAVDALDAARPVPAALFDLTDGSARARLLAGDPEL